MCVLPRFTTWVASFVLAVTFCHTAGADQTAAGAGPAQWADDLTAIDAQDWSYDRAAHLLERAGKIIASLLEDFERLLQDE